MSLHEHRSGSRAEPDRKSAWWDQHHDFRGRPAVVVATGPSLSTAQVRQIGLRRAENACRVMAVNDAVFVAWFADICFSGDGKWWNARKCVPGFAGRKVGLRESHLAAHLRANIDYVSRAGSEGCSLEQGLVYTNGNSGSMAVQIAAQLGADPIVLVGFDMRNESGRHFFGPYEQQDLHTESDMAVWVRNFRLIAETLGVRLLNATPGSALDFIRPVSLDAALGRIH